MRNWFRDPTMVTKTPVVTTGLLEGANISQLHEMWTKHTAKGQSLTGWVMVCLALILWYNFYVVCTPGQKWARRATMFGICMNLSVVLTVIYFTYLH